MRDDADRGVGRTFLRLGLTSFGGPVAHLGYFRAEVVARRAWLSDSRYADLVALAQFLPGPASSQVGMGVGLLRAGIPGSLRAWVGFTAPSAVLMIAAGLAVGAAPPPKGAVAGLAVAAAAVVALAVLQMAASLCRGLARAAIALATGLAVLMVPTVWMPTAAMALAAVAGLLVIGPTRDPGGATREDPPAASLAAWVPAAALTTFVALLVGLPVVARIWPGEWTTLIAGFYRAGALVFGGGHVVLPLLEDVAVGSGAVGSGWVSEEAFLAGYGLANALPGPLFTFAGYLGAAAGGVLLGVASVAAIFLPGYLLVLGVVGTWHRFGSNPRVRSALAGVNAAVVGLLAAALYDPVIRTGITGWAELLLGLAAFACLARLRLAPHLVVLGCAAVGLFVLQ